MSLDLVFGRPRYTPGDPLDLVFGATSTAPILPLEITGTVTFGGLQVSGIAVYDNRLPNSVSTLSRVHHQVGTPAEVRSLTPWSPPVPIDSAAPTTWQAATPDAAAPAMLWDLTQPVEGATAARWQAGTTQHARVGLIYQVCNSLDVLAALAWQAANQRAVGLHAPHQVAHTLQVAPVLRLQQGTQASVVVLATHQVGTPAASALRARWQAARPIPPGITVYEPTGGGVTPGREISLDLVFACPPYAPGVPLDLVFGHVCRPSAPASIVIPVRSLYMVHNNVTLHRVPSGAEFVAARFNLQADADSFTFGWSASLHSSARQHLARSTPGERVEVECAVNGVLLRLVVEQIGRDRSFPEHMISVRGRGRSAELSDPNLTFTNPANRTAQQLMLDVLTVNGASLGWTLDWQITDWFVPADRWVFQGSYIGALQDIASAAGAYLQPHRTDKVLRVLPRYAQAPWDWATLLTPDIELPVDATSLEGIEEVVRPDYNRVFVGGVQAPGYFGPVTRGGTAGDKVAPPIVHPLITAPEAHRQRGLAELSDTGVQEHLSLRTMVLPEAGIILPGKVVRYVDEDGPRVGIVRGTNVSMDRWPALHQTLEIETHVQ